MRHLRESHDTPPHGVSSADLRSCKPEPAEIPIGEDDLITTAEPWSARQITSAETSGR